jgi:hypothetical protein
LPCSLPPDVHPQGISALLAINGVSLVLAQAFPARHAMTSHQVIDGKEKAITLPDEKDKIINKLQNRSGDVSISSVGFDTAGP